MTAQLGQNERNGWHSITKVRKFVTVQAYHGTVALDPLNEWRKIKKKIKKGKKRKIE